MTDPRILAAIVLMGLAAAIGKVLDLWAWHVNQRPIIDTSTNGGVAQR